MNDVKIIKRGNESQLILVAGACLLGSTLVFGQSVQHLGITQAGGIPGQPTVTAVVPRTNGVVVTWDGPSGYYQLFEKQSLSDPTWKSLGPRTNLLRRAFVAGASSNAL